MSEHEGMNKKLNGVSRQLAEGEIIEFFEKLKLGSSTEREKFLSLNRLLNNLDSEQEQPNKEYRVVFGNSAVPDPTSD
jgi:hypothetical protein